MNITVIIPVYNCEEYIERCLNSVVSQDLENFEVIVINDGSTDGSVEIICEFLKNYSFLKFYSTDNRGVSAARNLGIDKSKGKYLFFLDADDYLLPGTLKYLYTFAIKNSLSFIFAGFDYQYKINTPNVIQYTSDEILMKMFENKLPRTACGILFNKAEIIKHGIFFDKELEYGEDFLFTVRFLSKIKTVGIVKNGFFYCVEKRENSSSRMNDLNHMENVSILESKLKLMLSNDLFKNKALLKFFQDELILSAEKVLNANTNLLKKINSIQKIKNSNLFMRYIQNNEFINTSNVNKKIKIYLLKYPSTLVVLHYLYLSIKNIKKVLNNKLKFYL